MNNTEKEIWEYWIKKSKQRKRIMRSIPVRAYQKLTNSHLVLPKYAGKPVCSKTKTNDKIKELISLTGKGKSVMVSRFGYTEMKLLEYYLEDCIYREGELSEKTKKQMECLCTYSGFFPYDDSLIPDFCKKYMKAAEQIDVLGTWNLY